MGTASKDREPKENRETIRLRAKARAEVQKKGLLKTAKRIGIQPDTLQRFVLGGSSTHQGTILLIQKGLS